MASNQANVVTTCVDLPENKNQPASLLSPADFTVGWIWAIPHELEAVRALLDQRHPSLLCFAEETGQLAPWRPPTKKILDFLKTSYFDHF